MPPLAPLLLALAALLAATNAQNNCNTQLFGVSTPIAINFTPTSFPARGGVVSTDDECVKNGKGVAVGNMLTACNADTYGIKPTMKPSTPNTISPIVVSCPDLCPQGGAVAIVQYCA